MPHDRFRWSAAVHEAGHAIAAWGLGLSIGGLEIFDADDAGRSWIEDNAHLGIVDRPAVCAAGTEAVALLDAGAHYQAGYSDRGKIIGLLTERPHRPFQPRPHFPKIRGGSILPVGASGTGDT
jgi:hypothetical protein